MNSQLRRLLPVLNLRNLLVGGDLSWSRCWVGAATILSNVWIVRGELKRMGFNVGESQSHETTIASVSGSIAVNDLLLRVINWVGVVGNGNSGRDSSGSGESPAGTTLSLVLDWGNFTSGNPIDFS